MSPFEKAFARARKEGLREFTFNGKRYHTKLKEEMDEGAATRPKKNPNKAPMVDSKAPAPPAKPKTGPEVLKTTTKAPSTPRPLARPTGGKLKAIKYRQNYWPKKK